MATPVLATGDISAFVTDFNLSFQDNFNSEVSWTDKYVTELPCNGSILEMPWANAFQQMRPFLGDRKVNSFVVNRIVYKPELKENTIGISRSDGKDGLELTLATAPLSMAKSLKQQVELEVSQALEANATTFDGVSFFSANHPVDSSKAGSPTTNSNVLLSSALTADNVAALQAQMMTLKLPNGLPANFYCAGLKVHPSKWQLATEIAHAGIIPVQRGSALGNAAGPVSNVFQGQLEVVIDPYASDPERWYLFSTNAAISPMLWVEADAPSIDYKMSPDDYNVFMSDQYLVGARRRAVAGLGLYYQMGVGTSAASLPSIAAPKAIQ